MRAPKHTSPTQNDEPPKASVSRSAQKSDQKPFSGHLVETAWRVALPFFIFVLGGAAIDRTIETSPIFTLIGLVIGVASISLIVYRYVDQHFPDTFQKNQAKPAKKPNKEKN